MRLAAFELALEDPHHGRGYRLAFRVRPTLLKAVLNTALLLASQEQGASGALQMKMSLFAAEAIAIDALTFIVSSAETAGRFIDVTGVDLSRIREEATKPDFLRGVMQFIIESDELIVACATAVGVKPEEVVAAGQILGVRWD